LRAARLLAIAAAGAAFLTAFGAIACQSDDGGGSDAGSPAAEADPEADPEPDPDPEPEEGVVVPPPEGAQQVDVTLQEWSVNPASDSVEAGLVYFLVENAGPDDPHEFVIIKTDEDPAELPVEEGRVPEDEVEMIDEIEPFTPGSSASIAVDLEPGSYALICNIAEIEGFELESHYELGMSASFTVE
jgi:uncharacterized cupredoxin-like copper-binding protein